MSIAILILRVFFLNTVANYWLENSLQHMYVEIEVELLRLRHSNHGHYHHYHQGHHYHFGMNIQYDTYRNTKQILKAVCQNHTDKLRSNLTSQGFLIIFLLNHSLKTVNSLWSSAQSKLPKNIFNFTVRYLNNTLATQKNLPLWNLSQTSNCSLLLQVVELISAKAASHGEMTLH